MADTWGVFRAAYIIAAVVYGGYALTIWLRAKRVREKIAEAERFTGAPAHRPAR
jgi:hypothetical protein